ncbi:MAG: hypothetical protein KAS23_05460 [Anaerohalosphaera sp.]|nr:hypothetical protein [Anaerohalosphaera sp.]
MKNTLPKKDFVVLCLCVAFLILSLGAIGTTGRNHAKSIICQTNLKQLANASIMFANDNDGKLFEYNFGGGLWMTPIAEYIGNMDNVRHCPSTYIRKDFNESSSYLWGSSKQAWMWNWGTTDPEHGSYGLNSWLFSFQNPPSDSRYFHNMSNVQFPATTPIFADSLWIDSGPKDTDICPATLSLDGNPNSGGRMSMHLMNRHYGITNVAFTDGHSGPVELKELWSLTWCNSWNIQHNMTREDGSPIYPEQ